AVGLDAGLLGPRARSPAIHSPVSAERTISVLVAYDALRCGEEYGLLIHNANIGEQSSMKQLHDLLDTTDPAWPLVQEWLAAAPAPGIVLPGDQERAAQTLLALQITTRSPLGAVIWETG